MLAELETRPRQEQKRREPKRRARGTIADYVRPESLAAYNAINRAGALPDYIEPDLNLSDADYKRAVENEAERLRLARAYGRNVIRSIEALAGQPVTAHQVKSIRDELTGYLRPENGGGAAKRAKLGRIAFILDAACKIVEDETDWPQLRAIYHEAHHGSGCCAGCQAPAPQSVASQLYNAGWRYCVVGDDEALHCPACIDTYVAGDGAQNV
jgi:hypothetical protein